MTDPNTVGAVDDLTADGFGLANGMAATDDEATLADEEAVRLARDQYRAGVAGIEPDAIVSSHLNEGEQVLGFRTHVTFARVDRSGGPGTAIPGWLYVTDQRLIHIGAEVSAIPLTDVIELTVTQDMLLMGLLRSDGVAVGVNRPRLLRLLITAAKTAARR
jgi:hypothetical protein